MPAKNVSVSAIVVSVGNLIDTNKLGSPPRFSYAEVGRVSPRSGYSGKVAQAAHTSGVTPFIFSPDQNSSVNPIVAG